LPARAVPKGRGSIRVIGGKVQPNAPAGTGSLSAPIATSPGRAGSQLGLSLEYDSGSGKGLFGLSWRRSTAAIARKTNEELPRYEAGDDAEVFVLSGAEDLWPLGIAADDAGDPGSIVHSYRLRIEGLIAGTERRITKMAGDELGGET
jgi:hypothetical protein